MMLLNKKAKVNLSFRMQVYIDSDQAADSE